LFSVLGVLSGPLRGRSALLFGLSLSKVLMVVTVAFLLFGVPLMALLIIWKERRKRSLQ
jgi:hypothetical protein